MIIPNAFSSTCQELFHNLILLKIYGVPVPGPSSTGLGERILFWNKLGGKDILLKLDTSRYKFSKSLTNLKVKK